MFFCSKWKFILITGCLLIAIVLLATGCGGSDSSNQGGPSTVADQGVKENLDRSKNLSDADGVETSSKLEKEIAEEAIRHAQDSNPGSEFEVTSIMVAGKWARVNIQEIEVPVEEAVAFVVFLRKESDGEWAITKTGTSIAPEDLPEAPSELFE